MKLLAVLLLSLASLSANADELIVGHVSKHFNPDQPMRENNPGLGYRTTLSGLPVQVGFYRNSYDRNTVYLLADVTEKHVTEDLSLKLLAGVATGYKSKFMLTPMVSYQLTKKIALDTIVMPPITGTTVLAFSIRYKLD